MASNFTISQGGNQDIICIDTDNVKSELSKVLFDMSFNAGTYSSLSLTSNYITSLFKKINDIQMEWQQDVTIAKSYCEKVESIPNPVSVVGTVLTGKATGNVYVRTGPGSSNKSLGVIHKGDEIEVIEKMSNGWVKIKYKGKEAYISGKYAQITETKATSQSTVTPSGTTNQQTVSPGPSAPSTSVTATGKATGNVNVRTGPGTSNKSIGVIHKGDKIEVVEKMSNGWVKVKYKGKEAYISGKYAQITETTSASNSTVTQSGTTNQQTISPGPSAPSTSVTATGKATGNVYVRTGPGQSNKSLGVIHRGDNVEVIEKLKNGWVKVKYKEKEAYVSGKYLNV